MIEIKQISEREEIWQKSPFTEESTRLASCELSVSDNHREMWRVAMLAYYKPMDDLMELVAQCKKKRRTQ